MIPPPILTFQLALCHVRLPFQVFGQGVKSPGNRNFRAFARLHRYMARARKQEVKLESTLDSVDVAEEMVKRFASEVGFLEDEVHQIGMAVRESVVNAVVHGNCYSSQKKVTLAVETEDDQLIITVQDQGLGFDLSEVPDPLAQENLLRKSGRGLFLIRAFMDELRVHRLGNQGTQVIMIKNSSPTTSKEDGK
jgi:serine/threonine-protein kinase RsbW